MTTIGLSYSLVKISTKCAPALMSPGWPIGHIPPSIVTWRAASIRRIGAGRWMGRWGDWSKPLKGFAFANDQRDDY